MIKEDIKMIQSLADIQFKDLFKLLPDAVVLVDANTKLPVFHNEVACTQLGYLKEQSTKQKLFKTICVGISIYPQDASSLDELNKI